MRLKRLALLALTAITVVIMACSDALLPQLYDEAAITEDIAANAGDAIATAIEAMQDNEGEAALPGVTSASEVGIVSGAITFDRTRTCYDANGAVVAGCSPLSSVRKVVTHVDVDGLRSGTRTTARGRTVTWSGAVHRESNDTLTRNFDSTEPPVEVSRTHSDLTIGDDTTSFSDGTLTRQIAESTTDSIKAVTWNLPRSSNPFPVSGSIVRVAAVHVVITKDNRTETRDITRKITVMFPADAQGNVVLTVNDKTCNLNLVTHVVSNCQ
jgi:hypothetical protein